MQRISEGTGSVAHDEPARDVSEQPWYADGLWFVCTGCGKCCTGSSGSVYVSQADLKRLAAFLHMPAGKFAKQYTRSFLGRRALIDRPRSPDCVFLEGKACTVYEARPTQCRTFPWWGQNLHDHESWEEAAESCEGINHPRASLIPLAEIEEQRRIDVANDASSRPEAWR
ncbi:MAG: YkgJ family cysteine cluster protein [Dehalococcoidia bacterium]